MLACASVRASPGQESLSILRNFVADARSVLHESPFQSSCCLVQRYSCLYLRLCFQIRAKVMTHCTDNQFKPLTRTDLVLRKLICQTSTNCSEGQCLVQFNTLFVHRSTGVVSPKTELSQPRFSVEHLVPESLTSEQDHGPLFPWWTCHCPFSLFRSDSNQSTQHLVDRRLHYQIQEHLHPMLVAAGVAIASRSLTYIATLLAVVLSIQVANVVLTTVVADQSVARTQSPEAVTKMALASDVVVVQVSRQLPTPRGSFTDNGSKEDCTVLVKGKAATVREGNAAAVSIGKFMNPELFDVCR